MSLASRHHVFISVQHAADRPSSLLGSTGDDAGQLHRTRFFSAKATTKALHSGYDFVGSNIADLCHI
jgi:hypothetical protein